jgi:long-chain acyl-CoA synthetase
VKALRPSYEMKRYTLPQLLRLRALEEGDRVALREKDLGIWNEVTYGEYYEKVLLFAHGLLSLGFAPGDRLAIIADNIPEWLYAELGAQAVRGISVGRVPVRPALRDRLHAELHRGQRRPWRRTRSRWTSSTR